jgi:glycosyltransferase involved in cell wall biosynthesis
MRRDRTEQQLKMKAKIIQRSNLNVVVASRYMEQMVLRSKIGPIAKLHHIPFGVDLDRFRPRDRHAARRRFGIFDGHIVVAVRATYSVFKGFEHFIQALERLNPSRPITVLAIQFEQSLNRFIGRYQIIEIPWTDDEDLLIDVYTAADIFVMPSTGEAFGMMAVEAMACARPVIVCEGTSLPEVAFAPVAGLSVRNSDPDALAAAIERLVDDPIERCRRGIVGRTLAEMHYDARLHVQRMSTLYRAVAGGAHRLS